MILVVQQYFGLGDIIWGQTIANDFIKDGYKVLWPVKPEYVDGLNRAYPNILFINYNLLKIDYENKEYKDIDGIRYLPMRYSEYLMGKPYRYHMESKYSFLGKDWRRWKECAMPVRDYEKEKRLMNYLGIDGKPYNLIVTKYGGVVTRTLDIELQNGNKNIYLDFINGYSLFDWCSVIENAEIIHAVSSSTLYLFEILDLKAKEIHLYPRKPIENDFSYTEFIFSKKYILHL